jgi:hypothetical protein
MAALALAGCKSAGAAAQLNDGTLRICRATGDAASPYEEITLDFHELVVHADHEGDLIPTSADGCPTVIETGNNPGKLTICHATGSASNHTGDFIPAPQEGCPLLTPTPGLTATASADKVTICHATGIAKNPYKLITVSVNGLNGHDKHDGDIIPAPAAGCP